MTEQKFVYVDANYLKELEETAKKVDYYKGIIDGINMVIDRKTENRSEFPNNCEHITEDGVTCAKYPACDDCLDNPLNKVKGSERLVKGSEQTEPTISKMEQVDKDINVRSKDEPKLVKESVEVAKDLVKAFCEDGTWLERQGVYTLTLAEAKQRAVDIIESVMAKDEQSGKE